jgi:predicted nucleic acid-binding protein
VGGRAAAIFLHPRIEQVFTVETVLAEVQEYAAQLARKKRLPVDVVLMATAALPVILIDTEIYKSRIEEAKCRIGPRDPDDVELLALALHLGLPIWSNDNDFADAGVEWYTTADLVAALGG